MLAVVCIVEVENVWFFFDLVHPVYEPLDPSARKLRHKMPDGLFCLCNPVF
jgi:hypothetical protein